MRYNFYNGRNYKYKIKIERKFFDSHLFRIPHTKNWHTSNLRVWIIFRGTVDSVVGSNDKSNVSFVKVIVDSVREAMSVSVCQ